MKRILFYFSVLIIWHAGNAQEKVLKPQSLFKPLYQTFNNYAGSLYSPANSFKSLHTYCFTYSLPKGAIFCRMEDALHQRFNIWIKFRMGDDDRYSN
ncbi:MAG TPA: hypothetical protein VN922_13605 [Bacteroidia bacterium]|nr:hypothetical protein [Bacteroidia bacterium]